MPKAIPERVAIGDPFSGVVLQVGQRQALAQQPHSGAQVVAAGSFVVRYGVRFLEKPYLSIVPDLVVLDYGDMLTGEAAWDFLLRRSNLHPRADVVGYRSDGRDDMTLVRQLDLARPVEVLVYPDSTATTSVARPVALIAADTASIAPRLLDYLPRYTTLDDWLAEKQA